VHDILLHHVSGDVQQWCVCSKHTPCMPLGPVPPRPWTSGFWLFPFQRMNGLLGNTFTNNHDITTQFTCHFIKKCTTIDLVRDLPTDLQTFFFPNGLAIPTKKQSGAISHSCDIVDVTRVRQPLQLGSAHGKIINDLTGKRIPQAIIRPTLDNLTSSAICSIHKLMCMISGKDPKSILIERAAYVATLSSSGGTYIANTSDKSDFVYSQGWDNNGRQLQIAARQVKKFIDITFTIETLTI